MKQRTGSFLVWGASLMLVAAGGYLVFSKESGGPERREFGRATPVATQPVGEAAFADIIEAIGTTRANESVILTARVSETVERVNFQDGMRVEKGAIIVELTNFEEVALVRERKAAVLEAEQQFERVQNLVKSGNASRATLDQR
ncbi:MAG: hypothetical protein V3R73_07640, partial [Sphingomonadales bacterium]